MPKFSELPVGAKFRQITQDSKWVKTSATGGRVAKGGKCDVGFSADEYVRYPEKPTFADLPVGTRFKGGSFVYEKVSDTEAQNEFGSRFDIKNYPYNNLFTQPITIVEEKTVATKRVHVSVQDLKPGDKCYNRSGDELVVVVWYDGQKKVLKISDHCIYNDKFAFIDQKVKLLSECKPGDKVVVVDHTYVREAE